MKSGLYARFPTPGAQVAIGAAVSVLAFGAFFALTSGCGSSLAQCKLEAVERLPDDPFAINGHDVSNLVARLQNCRESKPDAGQ